MFPPVVGHSVVAVVVVVVVGVVGVVVGVVVGGVVVVGVVVVVFGMQRFDGDWSVIKENYCTTWCC